MKPKQIIVWVGLNIILWANWIMLIFETIDEGHSRYWTITAFLLILCVNASIYFNLKKQRIKNEVRSDE